MMISGRKLAFSCSAIFAVLLVFRDPIGRILTLSQVYLLIVGGLGILVRNATLRPVRVPGTSQALFVVLGLILVFFETSTLFGSLRGSIDSVQSLRDLRDLAVLWIAVGFYTFTFQGYGYEIMNGLATGSAFSIAIEFAMRPSPMYETLFMPPYLGYRYVAGFQGPNEYGAFCSMVFCVSLGLLITADTKAKKVLYMVFGGVAGLAVLSTFSVGSVIGLLIGFLTVVGTWMLDSGGIARMSRIIAILLGILVIILIGSQYGPLGEHLALGLNRFTASQFYAGFEARRALFAAAGEIGARVPLLGAGLGAFAAENAKYGGTGTLSPHSEIAKSFAEGGLLGAGLLVLLFAISVASAWKLRSSRSGYAVLGGVVAYVIAEQFFSYMVRPGFGLCLVLLLAAMGPGYDSTAVDARLPKSAER